MALSKDEVIEIVRNFLNSACKRHDIREAYIFGSFATGRAKDYSDIDLALVLGSIRITEESPFDEYFEMFHEAQQYNSLLEVICFLKDDFEKDGGVLVKKIKKEGIRII